jgi:predicted nucleic acid-binding protein
MSLLTQVCFPARVAPLRCVIDSMVFDLLAEHDDCLRTVDRLTSARRLELLAAVATIAEIAAVPDRARRKRLQRVRVLVLPQPSGRGHAPVRRLRARPGVSDDDARIAATAALHGVPLVTEDAGLRAAAAAELPGLEVWRWEADLRPRIGALADALDP